MVLAFLAFNPGKVFSKIAAAQVLVDHLAHDISSDAISALISLLMDRLELGEEASFTVPDGVSEAAQRVDRQQRLRNCAGPIVSSFS